MFLCESGPSILFQDPETHPCYYWSSGSSFGNCFWMLILILAFSVIIARFQCLSFLLWFLFLGTFSQSIFGFSLLFLWESSRN